MGCNISFSWDKKQFGIRLEKNCKEENFLDEEEPSPELANINLLSSKLESEIEMNAEVETEELETLHSKDES